MQSHELYQELVIEHGTQPRNCRALSCPTHTAEGYNPLCGDRVQVDIIIANDQIVDIAFQGVGCAISTASASLMTEMCKNQPICATRALLQSFLTRLTTPTPGESLGKLDALLGVKRFPSRIKCATLAWHALQTALRAHHEPE